MPAETLGQHYLSVARSTFLSQKSLADRAVAQVTDEQLFWQPGLDSNSIAILMKHLAGNMLSRWQDILTTDGEKPTRKRDEEFVNDRLPRAELVTLWERGWKRVFDTLDTLAEEDLRKTITTRGKPHTLLAGIQGHVSHYGYHAGQIVYIARHLASDGWKTLSIPKRR